VHPRVASRLDAVVYAFGVPTAIEATPCDIGAGGVCIETSSPVGINEAHRIALEMGDEVLRVSVRCRWQRESPSRGGVISGLQFVDVSEEGRTLIWRHVYAEAQDLALFVTTRSALSSIAFDDAIELALHTRVAWFSKGDWVYRQGSLGTRGDSAFVVLSGEVAIEALNAESGRAYEELVLPGEVIGGFPMVAGLPHPETAIARSDACLVEIDPYSYGYLLDTRPGMARLLTEVVLGRYATRLLSLIAGAPPRTRPMVHRFRGSAAAEESR